MLVGEGQERVEKIGYGRAYSVFFFLRKITCWTREKVYCLGDCSRSVDDYKMSSHQ